MRTSLGHGFLVAEDQAFSVDSAFDGRAAQAFVGTMNAVLILNESQGPKRAIPDAIEGSLADPAAPLLHAVRAPLAAEFAVALQDEPAFSLGVRLPVAETESAVLDRALDGILHSGRAIGALNAGAALHQIHGTEAGEPAAGKIAHDKTSSD